MATFYPPPPPSQGPTSGTPPFPHRTPDTQITVALTGVSAQGQTGQVLTANDVTAALTGVATTGAAGTGITPTPLLTLSGVATTGSVGQTSTVAAVLWPPTSRLPLSILINWWEAPALDVVTTWTLAPDNPDQPPRTRPLSVQTQQLGRTWDQSWAVQRSTTGQPPPPALTGVQTAGQTGTFSTLALDTALTGTATTTSVGIITAAGGLTVVVATGSVGTLGTPLIDVPLTGTTAAGVVGTVSAGGNFATALSGVATTGTLGTLTVSPRFALTGVTTTGAISALTPLTSVRLSSVTTTGNVGSVSPSGGTQLVTLTGVSTTGHVGDLFVFGIFEPFFDATTNYYYGPGGRVVIAD